MLAVVVAAAAAALPPQGLVTRAAAGVVLVDVRGHVLGHLDGFRLDEVAEPARRPLEVLLRKGSVSYALGRRGLRLVARLRGGWPRTATGCHPAPLPRYLARSDGTGLRPAVGSEATESLTLGWTRSGRAVLDLPRGACDASVRRPGIYLLDPRTRRASFVYRGHGRLWGSAFAR